MTTAPRIFEGGEAWLATRAWATTAEAAPPVPFVLVTVKGFEADQVRVCTAGSAAEQRVPASALSASNSEVQPDNALLLNLSEAALLDNILRRYSQEEPYTFTGGILTSVNPCKSTQLYTADKMTSYAGRLLGGGRPPHLYAIAEEAYRRLLKTRSHQGMVVSGVSGAGKTEANKIIMQYLCWRASHSAGQLGRTLQLSPAAIAAAEQLAQGGVNGLDELPRRILNSNIIFEAFGNASTTNNDNSSRFGKFVRLLFSTDGAVVGARVSTYLLEKSRLTSQCMHERNFHALYQLLSAATGSASQPPTPTLAISSADLGPPSTFHYLNTSGVTTIKGVDDVAAWAATSAALTTLGLNDLERAGLSAILCGVLHLGNVSFEDMEGATADGCRIGTDAASDAAFAILLRVWQLPLKNATAALTTRRMDSGRGSTYSIGQTAVKATQTRDALAKAVYHRAFGFLAWRINAHLGGELDSSAEEDKGWRWVGLLDAFGFELLQRNSFEQLLINATNEQLQQFFLRSVMQAEQTLYDAEKIAWSPISYQDNAATIALLHQRPRGLLPMIDEECKLPNGSDEALARKAVAHLLEAGHAQGHAGGGNAGGTARGPGTASNPRGYELRKKPSARAEGAARQSKALYTKGIPHFTVTHFAGEVCYECTGWLDKNADNLYDDLSTMLLASELPLLSMLFRPATPFSASTVEAPPEEDISSSSAAGGAAGRRGRSTAVRPGSRSVHASGAATICARFARELDALMAELDRSSVHFVRCLKPNDRLVADRPDATLLLDQLLFSGMLEAVELMRGGFPGRIPFVEIHRRFHGKLPASVMRMSPGDFVRAVISAVDLPAADYQIGTSRLFFRTGGADFLRELQHADPDELVALLKDKMMRWWAFNSLLPAAVLGNRGRQIARERRAAVGVIHFNARMWVGKLAYRRMRRQVVYLQRCRREVLWQREAAERQQAILSVQAAARRKVAFRRAHELRSAASNLASAAAQPASMLDLAALQHAIEIARRSHVGRAPIDAAAAQLARISRERQEATDKLRALMALAAAAIDVDALEDAVAASQSVGVHAALLDEATMLAAQTAAARSHAQDALRSLVATPAATIDLAALQHAAAAAAAAGVAPSEVDAARARHDELSRQRAAAAADLQLAARPAASSLALPALQASIEAASTAGVDAAVVAEARAKCAAVAEQRSIASAALAALGARPPAELVVGDLEHAIAQAVEAGVAEAEVAAAAAKFSEVRGLRESSTAQLAQASAPPPSSLDLDALEASLQLARIAGLPQPTLDEASALLERVGTQRAEAARQLSSLLALPTAQLSLTAMASAVEMGSEWGVGRAEVEAAAARADEVRGRRIAAASDLETHSGRKPRDYSAIEVEAALATAEEVGVDVETVATARAKLGRVREAREAANLALSSALAPTPRETDLEAVLAATQAAEDAGVGTEAAGGEALRAAQGRHDELKGRRQAAVSSLEALRAQRAAAVDLEAFSAAVEEAADSGVGVEAVAVVARVRDELQASRLSAAVRAQTMARRAAARRAYARALHAATRIQAGLRRLRVVEITSELLMAARLMRAGSIFMKFSQNGAPHDRWVWLDESMRSLQWADPEKRKKGILKGADATLMLTDVIAISEGIKSELGKHQTGSFLQSIRAFKGGTSGIAKLDQGCCLTVLGKERSLDLQAQSRLVRQDWLMAMRLVLTMRAIAGLSRIQDRRKLREFIKPKPRKRTKSAGGAFANFFGARARGTSAASAQTNAPSGSQAAPDGAPAAGKAQSSKGA